MTLVYYDIFAFLLLLGVGTLIEDKKRAVLTLLSLSLFLTAISAYLFFTNNITFENEFYIDSSPGSLEGDILLESEIIGGRPYGLYGGLFFIVWITFYSFSFLVSRGVRGAYFSLFKKIVNRF